jgi:hypothetical protein
MVLLGSVDTLWQISKNGLTSSIGVMFCSIILHRLPPGNSFYGQEEQELKKKKKKKNHENA